MSKNSNPHVAVIGVGAVGVEMLRVLKERAFPAEKISAFARSSRDIDIDGQTYSVKALTPECFDDVDIALFAGTEGEKGAAVTFSQEAIKRGAVVIDNGADFRMDKKVPLVIPEVNPDAIKSHKGIIANPNCSTIQMVVALSPIYKKVGLEKVIVTTLQAASGAGRSAITQLIEENTLIAANQYKNLHVEAKTKSMAQQLAYNVIPHIGGFNENDFTSEEWKLVRETHKILSDSSIAISATTIRVPVRTGHSESIYLETRDSISLKEIRELLSEAPGIILVDDPNQNIYPMPKDSEGKDQVFVGRIRKDPSCEKGFWLWVVADNLRKGAATNAVQIAETLVKNGGL